MKSRDARVNIRNFERVTNVKHYGNHTLMHKGTIVSRVMQETIRVIDRKKADQQHGEQNEGCRYESVDAEARNVFNSKVVTPSMIKCAHGFNHFG